MNIKINDNISHKEVEIGDIIVTKETELFMLIKDSYDGYSALELTTSRCNESCFSLEGLIVILEKNYKIERIIKADKLNLTEEE